MGWVLCDPTRLRAGREGNIWVARDTDGVRTGGSVAGPASGLGWVARDGASASGLGWVARDGGVDMGVAREARVIWPCPLAGAGRAARSGTGTPLGRGTPASGHGVRRASVASSRVSMGWTGKTVGWVAIRLRVAASSTWLWTRCASSTPEPSARSARNRAWRSAGNARAMTRSRMKAVRVG